ncbi:unnamed protein product, partial [Polarella glacialis]
MEMQAVDPNVESFYRFCLERLSTGVTDADLAGAGWTDSSQILRIANTLLGQGRLNLQQLPNGRLIYKAVEPQLAAKFSGLDAHARMVYQFIEKTGDKGAWSKSLKDQTNLQQHTITKATKDLMKKQLIKEVKSVQKGNRKVFMLIDLEPAREVSGGTWYQDGEFNTQWVESLREQCQEFLDSNNGRAVSLPDIHRFVMQQPGPQVPTEDDISSIM